MPTAFTRRSLLFVLIMTQGSGHAASAYEQEKIHLIQQHFDAIEHLAARARTKVTIEPNERFRFDYLRLIQDIQRIRQGVQSYLSPTRAQPRDPDELVGDYRPDTPPVEPSP